MNAACCQEIERRAFVEGVFEILEFTLDDGFLTDESLKAMFTFEEFQRALELVEGFLTNRLEDEIHDTARNFSRKGTSSPESHFDTLSSALKTFREEFKDSPAPILAIDYGVARIRETIQELEEEQSTGDEDYEGHGGGGRLSESSDDRSVFDDIDE